MHSPIPNENANGLFLSSLSYISASGIGLFFMISGALLLSLNLDVKNFLKKRFTKVVFPAIIWSILYLCANILMLDKSIGVKALLSIPFSTQGTPVFWFIYTLLGLYLLAPILSRWLNAASRKELEFYLALWGISLCYPFLKYVVDINTSNTGILYYFSGYVGYFILGYYLKTYPNRISWKMLSLALAVSITVPVICKLQHIEVDFYDLFWYLSIFVVIQCACWWKAICCIKQSAFGEKASHFITELSKMTFGVYLVHIFIMRYILWRCDFILNIENYYLQTATIIVLTFALSALCTYLIGLLPKSQYLIGYKTLNSKL
jgi:surface polysaccharide O-acyltransferase-like enzyme